MIRRHGLTEDGLTGLELVVLVIAMIAGTAFLLVHISGGAPDLTRTFPGGLVAESMYLSGDNIHTVGNVYGLSMISIPTGTPRIIVVHEDPGLLGVVRTTVALSIGDTGAIDMDSIRVQWANSGSHESIARSADPVLICPNWTISNKFNLLPGRTADSDNWLEPNEQFELVLCPSGGARPYESFSFTLQPDGVAIPLSITRTVPPRIQPVMNLG
jgi:hypothetical protein